MEVHTSDLTKPCLRAVSLRLNGKAIGSTQSAKAWGLLWHEAATACHRLNNFAGTKVGDVVSTSWQAVADKAKDENSPLSDAVNRDIPTIMAEVAALLPVYGERCVPLIGKFIGCEVPIRATLDVDGEDVEFASHLDLLCRDKDGGLMVWDWKGGKDSPSFYELSRNMQFGMYGWALRYGSVLIDGEWVEFREWPSLYWVQVRNLKPFGRATVLSVWDETKGERVDVSYEKGQHRPLNKIVIPSGVYPEGEGEILRRFAEHVRLRRAGIMPAIPGEHCQFCDSKRWCDGLGGTGEAY